MRMAFLTREYPPDTLWGGVAVVYHTLARALVKRGHEVHVICQAVDKPKDLVEEGIFVHRVGTNPKRYSAIARINYSFYAWRKLREVIKKYRIEIVESTYWGADALLYSLNKHTPLIVRLDVSASDILRTKTYSGIKQLLSLKILSYLENFSAKRADQLIAISKDIYTEVIKRLYIDPAKVNIVYHAIDTEKYRFVESDVRERLEIAGDIPLVLFVGRLELRKGIHVLCQAIPEIIKSMPTTRFMLIGRDTNTAPNGGSFKSYILDMAQAYGLQGNIVFIDFSPPEELVQLYSACDVFVSPSLHESFGLPTLEAMACGRPVVATPTGIVPELEAYGLKGLEIVPIGDAGKLAQAIIRLLALGEEESQQIARENRQLVEAKFLILAWADKTIEVYEKVLRRG